MEKNTQEAPFPHELKKIIDRLVYKPGWEFELIDTPRGEYGDGKGLTFHVRALGYNAYYHERGFNHHVNHYFPVPALTWDEKHWRRWILDRFTKIELHEVMEFMGQTLEDGTVWRPFAPAHGPGNNIYSVNESGSETDLKEKKEAEARVYELREQLLTYGLRFDPLSKERKMIAAILLADSTTNQGEQIYQIEADHCYNYTCKAAIEEDELPLNMLKVFLDCEEEEDYVNSDS